MIVHERPLALDFPLRGSQLIEASAGTGKTYTISALYLRLILGHGGERAFAERLLPPQILVVTFTDAATRELRERIRSRLVEAAALFRGEAAGDALLHQLRDDIPAGDWPASAQRLELAAQWMDEAAVSTIHGWCQRMLREHAFDSGSLFQQELEPDLGELLDEVVRDYWRLHGYPLQGAALDWVVTQWGTPQALRQQLLKLLDEAPELPAEPLAERLETALAAQRSELARLKAAWPAWLDELQLLLDEASEHKRVNGTKLRPGYYRPWLEQLRSWAGSDALLPELSSSAWARLTPEGLADAWKSGNPFEHPALLAMQTLREALAAVPLRVSEGALLHAAGWVAWRVEALKQQRALMGYDDLLRRLDAALRGANGGQLATVIRRQFPVALIDEFQDTDPLQYRIFDSLYQVAGNRDDCGLFMIGDPKQAIYSFRGADIHTYLQARRATTGRHHNLECNFRSSTAMVAAVNALFQRAEASAEGAFLQGEQLPFLGVQAAGRAEQWMLQGEPGQALTLWSLASSEPLGSASYRQALADSTASEIVRLLNLGQAGQAGFCRDGQLQPLQPGDIAVLVRSLKEAQLIRAALAARGVRTVYLSDKDSVYASAEARDVLLWLRACAEPDQDRPLRAALASASLDLPLAALEQLNLDERHWELRVMQFRGYRQLWQSQGVLPMLRQLLQDFSLPQRLLQRGDGERRLTNLLHLAELLQQASSGLDGEQALLRFLGEQRLREGGSGEDTVVRLESDEALVRVVTIHKAKGLEYPLVFLPFICSARPPDGKQPLFLHDGEQRRLLLTQDQQQLSAADHERLAEDVRLLYVALTRARHACWLGLADLRIGQRKDSQLHRTAIGRMLGLGQPLEQSAQLGDWLEAVADPAHTCWQALPEADDSRYQPAQAERPAGHWREPLRRAAEHWWIASYSALRLTQERTPDRHDDSAPDSPAMQIAFDDEPAGPAPTPAGEDLPGLHGFPRGPNPGTFLHGVLELAADEGFARCLAQPQLLREAVARRCQRRGLEAWIEPLQATLQAWLGLPIHLPQGTALRLGALQQYRAELEFCFEAHQVQVQALDALVCSHELPGQPRPALAEDRLNGMFKGFIDLVFEHDGRYYVADYKSNWLGGETAAYRPEAMTAAVLEHRYDLQYLLYVLALHRQLRLRLADYDYQTHMGGALYLFLRAPVEGVYFVRPQQQLIERLDALFAGQQPEGDA